MSATNLILIGVAAVAIFGALGAFVIAFRRSSEGGETDWKGQVGAETRRADRSLAGVRVEPIVIPPPEAVVVPAEAEEAMTAERPVAEPEPVAVSVVEAQRVVEVSPEEAGVTRRQFFNRAMGATFGIWTAGLSIGFLAFFWPRVTGGFGADIVAGTIGDIQDQVRTNEGAVIPLFVPEARAYIVPAPTTLSSQFEGRDVEGGGLMALYQRCVHLGCRVPWCATSQGFECPCHGSKYNEIGEYFAGPAPRNLDRFVVEVNEADQLVIHTGTIIETPRAPIPSVEYPRGPSCIGV
ncbi:MAG TPA: ubiquinol-cytochrome c reductase iron-sulfur subunit [Acidimicrobiia bacterium]|nr:ubiquinol-cytochrome c reductase iron-sulfur subunit [Acidimicrobiia bacterium]